MTTKQIPWPNRLRQAIGPYRVGGLVAFHIRNQRGTDYRLRGSRRADRRSFANAASTAATA